MAITATQGISSSTTEEAEEYGKKYLQQVFFISQSLMGDGLNTSIFFIEQLSARPCYLRMLSVPVRREICCQKSECMSGEMRQRG